MITGKFLTSEEWTALFPKLLPMLQDLWHRADNEWHDWDIADLDLLVRRGQLLSYVLFEDNEPAVFFAGQWVYHPRTTVFHVTFCVGKLMKYKEHAEGILKLIELSGASAIEAWCRPSVARLLRRFGFKYVASVVRRGVI